MVRCSHCSSDSGTISNTHRGTIKHPNSNSFLHTDGFSYITTDIVPNAYSDGAHCLAHSNSDHSNPNNRPNCCPNLYTDQCPIP
jgi:hypothetical protein